MAIKADETFHPYQWESNDEPDSEPERSSWSLIIHKTTLLGAEVHMCATVYEQASSRSKIRQAMDGSNGVVYVGEFFVDITSPEGGTVHVSDQLGEELGLPSTEIEHKTLQEACDAVETRILRRLQILKTLDII